MTEVYSTPNQTNSKVESFGRKTEFRLVDELIPHPLNAELYGSEENEKITDSIDTVGIITPVIITAKNAIISGHSRWLSAKKRGDKHIEVLVSPLEDETEIQLALVHSNKQRKKTREIIGREYETLRKLYRKRKTVKNLTVKDEPGQLAAKDLGVSKPTAIANSKIVKRVDELRKAGKTEKADRVIKALNDKSPAAAKREIEGDPKPQAKKLLPIQAAREIEKKIVLLAQSELKEWKEQYPDSVGSLRLYFSKEKSGLFLLDLSASK